MFLCCSEYMSWPRLAHFRHTSHVGDFLLCSDDLRRFMFLRSVVHCFFPVRIIAGAAGAGPVFVSMSYMRWSRTCFLVWRYSTFPTSLPEFSRCSRQISAHPWRDCCRTFPSRAFVPRWGWVAPRLFLRGLRMGVLPSLGCRWLPSFVKAVEHTAKRVHCHWLDDVWKCCHMDVCVVLVFRFVKQSS